MENSAARTGCLPAIATLLLSTLPCIGQTTLKEVLSWLPADTESVVGENGPFALPDFDSPPPDLRQPELPVAELERQTRMLAVGLFGLKNGGLQKSPEKQICDSRFGRITSFQTARKPRRNALRGLRNPGFWPRDHSGPRLIPEECR